MEYQRYPGNQEAYIGPLIPSSLTRINMVQPCENCEEFQEICQDNQLCVKSCLRCFKEYVYCFCNQICYEVTPGGRSNYNYEYVACTNKVCEFLGVRCTTCLCLCKIIVSNQGNLFWGCKNNNGPCHFYKQHVIDSLRNHIESCKNLLTIDVKILCEYIYRYVDNLVFINVLKRLHYYRKLNEIDLNEIIKYLEDEHPNIVSVIKNEIIPPTTPNRFISQDNINNIINLQDSSPTPNEFGLSNSTCSINRNDLKRKFDNEMQENFYKLENDLRRQNEKNFRSLKDELKQDIEDFKKQTTEDILEKYNQQASSITSFREDFLEFKNQNQFNFSRLFNQLRIDDVNGEEPPSKATRKSKRIKERNQQTRGGRKTRGVRK